MKAVFLHGRPFSIDYTPAGDVAAGDVVVINSRLFIAHADIAANALGALSAGDASYTIAKDTSTFAVGDPWYWDAGAKLATSTSGGNTFGGFCEGAAATGLATVAAVLLLAPATLTVRPGIANPITDPGNGGAIPVTGGNVQIVTAGAETRTLAAATAIGVGILIVMKTHVGNCVITVASTINSTGNNTITMSAAGQAIELVSIITGSTFEWAVRFNDGTALSTV
jgi:predicted RecA/RadA family phage recombinase